MAKRVCIGIPGQPPCPNLTHRTRCEYHEHQHTGEVTQWPNTPDAEATHGAPSEQPYSPNPTSASTAANPSTSSSPADTHKAPASTTASPSATPAAYSQPNNGAWHSTQRCSHPPTSPATADEATA